MLASLRRQRVWPKYRFTAVFLPIHVACVMILGCATAPARFGSPLSDRPIAALQNEDPREIEEHNGPIHTLGLKPNTLDLKPDRKSTCDELPLDPASESALNGLVPGHDSHALADNCVSGPDSETLMQTLLRDASSTLNRENTIILGVAALGAIGAHQELDGRVRSYTARHAQNHEQRFGSLHDTLDTFGHPAIQWPVIVGIYGYARLSDNEDLRGFGGSLMSALGLTTASTFAIKGIVNTKRPTDEVFGGELGFPSYHTSSSFALATVANEYYGPQLGLPSYGLAALIGWSRIDERDHDLSDVIFGAALGYVIGKSVAHRHQTRDHSVRLLPYIYGPPDAVGVSLEARY